jgi:hypothetical protein
MRRLHLAALLLVAGCGDGDNEQTDARTPADASIADAAVADAAVADAASVDATVDAAPEIDAAPDDAAPGDAAPVDAAPVDAAPDAAPGCTWQAETVESSVDPGRPVIAADPAGGVHILFANPTGCHSLRYAYKAPGATTWTVTTFATNVGQDYQFLGLVSDPAGGLHASYFQGTPPMGCPQAGPHVRYGYKPPGGAWGTYFVAAPTTGGQDTSVAVDTTGEAHLVFDGNPNSLPTLEYGHGRLQNWTVGTVPSTVAISYLPTMRVDRAGRVHVSVQGAEAGVGMVHAERSTTGTWTTTPIDPTVRGTSSVDVDAAGGVHIVYSDQSQFVLHYAYRPSGGAFTSVPIDTTYSMAHPTIRVDSTGVLHVIYASGSPFHGIPLQVHHGRATVGGTWDFEPVGTDTPVFGPSLALGPADAMHVAYARQSGGQWDVRYARQVCPGD